jgi:ABC-type nitrate/sulfonate/bicarbonate transport system substrate-binding protein
MGKKKQVLIVLGLIVLAVLAFLVARYFNRGSLPKNAAVVRIGEYPGMTSAPFIVASHKGFFEEEGVKVEVEKTDSQFRLSMIDKGDLDLAIVSPAAGTFNAFAKGAKARIIADTGQGLLPIVIRKPLWETGAIRDIKDFKGKNVRVTRGGSLSYFTFAFILEKEGIDITKDVKVNFLRDEETVPALSGGLIDGGILTEPYATLAVAQGLAVRYPTERLSSYFAPAKGHELEFMVASEKLIRERPDQLRAFLRGYMKGVDFFIKARSGKQPERSEAVKFIAQELDVPEDVIEKCDWFEVGKGGRPDEKSIEQIQDFWVKTKFLDEKVDLSKFIDTTFLPAGTP